MKRLSMILAFVAMLSALSKPASALEGSVSGIYEYDNHRIDDVKVALYKIADYTKEDGYLFREGFDEVDIVMMTNSQLGEYGEDLSRQVETEEPITETYTVDGEYRFNGMDEGIYLITFEDILVGRYAFSALPIVLTMPNIDELYEQMLTVKLQRECVNCEDPKPKPPTEEIPDNPGEVESPPEESGTPNTHDIIKRYVNMFAILIIIEAIMLYVIIKEGKKERKNEKQK